IRFLEKPVLGDVFAYHCLLRITGALWLTLPASLTDIAKQAAQKAVRQKLEAYLSDLNPEADVVFQEMVALARTVDPVQAAYVDASDFRVRLNDGPPLPARVGSDKIEVSVFEKAELEHFCIASSTQAIEVAISQVAVNVTVSGPAPTG